MSIIFKLLLIGVFLCVFRMAGGVSIFFDIYSMTFTFAIWFLLLLMSLGTLGVKKLIRFLFLAESDNEIVRQQVSCSIRLLYLSSTVVTFIGLLSILYHLNTLYENISHAIYTALLPVLYSFIISEFFIRHNSALLSSERPH